VLAFGSELAGSSRRFNFTHSTQGRF